MIRTEEIRIRDPYVVVYQNAYYMYRASGKSILVHKSTDLKNWEEPVTVYTLSENSWAYLDLWAPEVHAYKGKFYLFLSLLGKNELRGTEISVCDTPDGTFLPISNKPATPSDRSCIDGTLYVEGDTPYLVYSADWPHNYDQEHDYYVGEIWAVQLREDLKEQAGEPFLLFRSNEAPCSKIPAVHEYRGKTVTRFGSDAPYLIRLQDGTLYLTWSPIPDNNYIVAAAVSDNNSIKGNWIHLEKPLFDQNGGHGMFFYDLGGNRKLCLHCPERPPYERALFLNTREEQGRLVLADENI